MTYEAYESRMLKIAKVLDKIRKYRVLIISVLAAVLVAISTLVGIKGMIIEDATAPSSPFIYGESFEFYAEALFGEASFEYTREGEKDWSTDRPVLPGVYSVRAVSRRAFGIKSYGKVFSLEIVPLEITVSVSGSAVYGESPNLEADFIKGDRVEGFDYEYEDPYAKTTAVTVDSNSLKISSSSGTDVSTAYKVTVISSEVTFTKRPITVTFANSEKVYDGNPLYYANYELSSEIAKGDTFVFDPERFTSATEAGEYENINYTYSISNKNGMDMSDMYEIKLVPGKLTVLPREIKITSDSGEKIYDGKPLVKASYQLSETSAFAEGQTASVAQASSITNVGVIENELSIRIFDTAGNDVTKNYVISVENGSLTVNKRPISLVAENGSWEYDGTEHTAKQLDKIFTLSDPTALVETEVIKNVMTEGKITFVGECETKITSVDIYNEAGTRVTENYDISYISGKLRVTARKITVTTPDLTKEYDAKPIGGEKTPDGKKNYELSVAIGSGDKLALDYETITNVLETKAGNNVVRFTVTRDGADISENYEFTYKYGTLTVTPRPITVGAVDYSWEYDGTEHSATEIKNNIAVISGKVVSGQTITAVTVGAVTDANDLDTDTKAVHSIDKCKITDADGNDLTSNYEITTENGALTVTRRPIRVNLSDGSWYYNGIAHTPIEIADRFTLDYLGTVGTGALVLDHIIDIISTGTVTEVPDVSEHGYDSFTIYDAKGVDRTRNYDVTVVSGRLTIKERPITITLSDAEWVYDGKLHSVSEISALFTATLDLEEEGAALVLDHIFVPDSVGSIRNIGTADHDYLGWTLTDSNGVDKSYNYSVNVLKGTLTVTPRPITVYTGTKTAVYNASVVMLEDAGIVAGSLAEGQRIFFYDFASIINVGAVTNSATVIITDADELPTTDNYEITYEFGTITVTKRPIELTAQDGEWIYDGLTHTGNELTPGYLVTGQTPIVDGHFAVVETEGSIVNVGTQDSFITSAAIYDEYSTDVTSNYDISTIGGILTVTPRPIIVVTEDLEKPYDATPLRAEQDDVLVMYGVPGDIRLDLDAIVYGDTISSYDILSEIINVSESGAENKVEIKISRNGLDATSNYSIVYSYGTLVITPREITITANDNSWEYDGMFHGADEIVEKVTTTNLVTDHRLVPVTSSTMVQGVSDIAEHKVVSFTVLDKNGADVTANYTGTYVSGTLTIDPRPISVTMGSEQWIYDGLTHYGSDLEIPYTVSYEGEKTGAVAIIDGHTIFVTSLGSITNVGTEAHTMGTVLITDASSTDVSENYDVTYSVDGVLEVVPRELTVTTGSASKVYDDTPLKAESYEITYGTVITDYDVIVDYVTELIEVGLVDNVIDFSIVDAYGYDVTFNYDITFEYGTLEVIKRRIEIAPKDESFIYDATVHTPDEYILTSEDMLVANHEIIATYLGEIINVGTVETEIDTLYIYKDATNVTDNYDVVLLTGSINIDKRPITVITDDVIETYNGSYITGSENGVTIVYGTPDSLDYFAESVPIYDGVSCEFGEGIINVADSGVDNSVIIIITRDGENVTDNYDISYDYGTITVLKRVITVTTVDHEWEYDGLEHNSAEIIDNVTYENLVIGQILNAVTASANVKNAIDIAEHILESVIITDAGGNNVTDNYEINTVIGSLTVAKRKISITLNSGEWIYDGQTHTAYELDPRYTIAYSGITEGAFAIVDGQIVDILSTGSIKNKGTVVHAFGSMTVVDEFGADVSDNYEITDIVEGELVVTPRSITVLTGSISEVYNGTEISAQSYEITDGELVIGHNAHVSYLASLINVGKKENNVEILIFDENDEDVTENYDISLELGWIEVTKRPITISPMDQAFIYDGTEHSATEYVLSDPDSLVSGQIIYVTYNGSLTDVGSITVTVKRALIYSGTENVSSNYEISYLDGTLTVDPRPITVTTEDIVVDYNGKYVTGSISGVTVIYGVPGELDDTIVAIVSADTPTYTFGEGIKNVADSGAENTVILTLSRDDRDVSGNYSISYEYGTITLNKLDLEVAASGISIEYDGKWHNAQSLDSGLKFYVISDMADGHYVNGTTYSDDIKNVGKVLHTLGDVFVYDEEGNDVSENYNIIRLETDAYLEVTARTVNAQSSSHQKEYDGDPISLGSATVDRLVEGHTFNATYDVSEFADVADYQNTFVIYEILDENGEDVTDNYSIEYTYGTLTITPRKITITTLDGSKVYDGTAIRKDEYVISSGSLVGDHFIDAVFTAELINVGYVENEVDIKIFSGDVDMSKNYEITYLNGTLTVTKRVISITTGSGNWIYNGEYIDASDLMTPYTVGGEYGIVEGEELIITWNGYIDAGEYSADYSKIDIINSEAKSVLDNYGISSVTYGTIKIDPRPITLVTDDISEIYNGSGVSASESDVHLYYGTPENIDYDKLAIAGNDIATYLFSESIVNVADSGAENVVLLVVKRDNNDVSANYDISYVYGTVTVIARPISVSLLGYEWIYDGKVHNADELSEKLALIFGTLPNGHTLVADSCSDDIIDVGVVEHILIKAYVHDENGVDVSENYEITVDSDIAVLEIVARDIVIKSDSASKIYDGTALTKESVVALELCEGHTVNVNYLASIINAGEILNEFEFISISDAEGEDVSANYNISYEYGKLTVNRRPITIVTANKDKIYDGTPLSSEFADVSIVYGTKNNPDYTKTALVLDHQIFFIYEGYALDVSASENIVTVSDILSLEESVKNNYLINYSYGELVVNQRPITVITDDRSKEYDATELKGDEAGTLIVYGTPGDINYELVGVVDGEIVSYDFLGIINVSESGLNNNSVIISIFRDGENRSNNYSISYVYGSLTVTPRVISVKPNDVVFYYDGKVHSANDFDSNMTVTAGSLVTGHLAHSISEETIVEIGSKTYYVDSVEIISDDKDLSENYEIHLETNFATISVVEDDGTGENPEGTGGTPGGGSGGSDGPGQGSGGSGGPGTGGIIGDIIIDLLNPPKNDDGESGDDTGEGEASVILDVLASYTGKLLIRNRHYGDYLGTSWADAPSDEAAEALFMMAYALMNSSVESDSVSIKILSEVGYMLPYYATMDGVNTELLEYALTIYRYVLTSDSQLPTLDEEWQSFESEYREFAYANYTNLQTNTKRELRTILSRECPNFATMNRLDLVLWIESYVQNVAPYDMEFEVPEGTEDIAVWFLTDPDASGICSHFATAATALCRAAGIPARIVSGVSASVVEGEWVSVESDRAHAWVEVYFDGIGWITIDPTGFAWGGGEGPGPDGPEGPDNPDQPIVTETIVIESEDFSKFYDGTGVECEEYDIVGGTLKDGHQLLVYFDSPSDRILPGTYMNTFSAVIIDSEGNDVSDEYEIIMETGTLIVKGMMILPYAVNIAYDGNFHQYTDIYDDPFRRVYISEGWEILPAGAKIYAEVVGYGINVGDNMESYIMSYAIYDADDNDITADYADVITLGTSYFKVVSNDLEITTESFETIYTGDSVTHDVYEITSGALAEGHTLSVEFWHRDLILPGEYNNDVLSYTVLDSEGNDVSHEYNVTYVLGKITIKGIILSPYSVFIAYDGNTWSYDMKYSDPFNRVWVVDGDEILPDGYRISAVVSASATTPMDTEEEDGTDKGYSIISDYVIYDADGNDVTDIYRPAITLRRAEFKILKLNLSITTGSAERKYTATALTNKTYSITTGSLWEGHTISVTFTAKAINRGTYDNTVKVVIKDKDGNDVTGFYDIEYNLGKLVVK